MTDGAHQHSAELVDLLVNAISRLIKSKQGVIDFFAGCGVPDSILKDHRQRLRVNPSEVKKPIVARQILHALNAGNERFLGERRRVLQRVADWSDFSTCWPNDRDEAELYVQRVRKNIDSQDAFTRMNIEAQKERQKRLSVERIATEKKRKREEDRAKIRGRLVDLVSAVDPVKRGRDFEGTLNDLFALDEIRIREPFEVLQDFGVAEQIDGLVSVFGNLYLVEVKWHAKPLGPDIVGQHMMRLMARSEVRGLYISKSGFTSAAISGIRDTLALRSTICADLQEILLLLDRGTSLSWWIDEKTAAAVGSKNIYWRYGVDFSDRL